MDWHESICIDADVIGGKPAIRGTRLAVDYVLDLLANGRTVAEILAAWPGLTEGDVLACVAYARDAVRDERVTGYRLPA